jgi:hypothetical protein
MCTGASNGAVPRMSAGGSSTVFSHTCTSSTQLVKTLTL